VAESWTFLTNHAHVLVLLNRNPELRLRDLAGSVGITERATQRIVADLVKAGYIEREREGRRNLYSVRTYIPLGLPIQRDIDIGSLLAILVAEDEGE
jgi:hypothetical protein